MIRLLLSKLLLPPLQLLSPCSCKLKLLPSQLLLRHSRNHNRNRSSSHSNNSKQTTPLRAAPRGKTCMQMTLALHPPQ